MSFTPASHTGGTLHHYAAHLLAYEWPCAPISQAPSYLLFLGGLGDTLLSISYTHALPLTLPAPWRLVQAELSSSGTGWGTSSLKQDALEIGAAVSYLRRLHPHAPVVLMGSSTGCQDCVAYGNARVKWVEENGKQEGEGEEEGPYPPVQGLILQAPVSDRQALEMLFALPEGGYPFVEPNRVAREWVAQGRGKDVLPAALVEPAGLGAPVSAQRWLSLLSPGPEHEGEDDMFSSDLSDGRVRETWGRLGRGMRVLVLVGGAEQYVPEFVDKETLLRRWVGVMEGAGTVVSARTGIIAGADHTLSELCPKEVRETVFERVGEFLRGEAEGKGRLSVL